MLDPGTGLRASSGRQLWTPHPAPTEAAAVYSLFQHEHQHQTLVATPHRFTTTPNAAATFPCGTAALLASVHPQKDVITNNYLSTTLKPKLAKKRSWDEVVKVEPAPKSPCSCPNAVKKVETACSRTTPVSLSLVKKELNSGTSTPCQVAEVTTSVRVKQEISESSITTGTSGGIPVGIAVARQRNLDNGRHRGETPPPHPPTAMAPPTILQPPPLLLAGCDDRSMWSMPHTAPHWQYPPMEPSIPVGFQLVRDPMTGQLLLLPPTNVGVMLPCDMTSAAKTTHVSSAHQPLLASNPGLTLIQQLSTLANPPQFSTGSLLIQHISGSNSIPHTLLPHQSTGSVLISTQQLNSEPQLINTATAHAQHSTAVMVGGAGAAGVQPQLSHQLTTTEHHESHHVTTSTSTTLMTQSHAPQPPQSHASQQQMTVFDQPPPQLQQLQAHTQLQQAQQNQELGEQQSEQQQPQSAVNCVSISTTTTTTTVQQESSLAVQSADLPSADSSPSAADQQPQQMVATVTPVQLQLHAETQCSSDDSDSQPAPIVVEKKSQGTSPVSCLNGYSGDELEGTSDCDTMAAEESQDATFQDAGNQTESLSPAADAQETAPETPLATCNDSGDSVDATSCSNEPPSCPTITITCPTKPISCPKAEVTSCSTVGATIVDDTMQLNGLELLSYSIEKFEKFSSLSTHAGSGDSQTDCNQNAKETEKVASTETNSDNSVITELAIKEVAREEVEKPESQKDAKEELGKKFDGLSLLLSALAHQRDVEGDESELSESTQESPSFRRMTKFTKPALESTSAVCTVSHTYKSEGSKEEVRRLIERKRQREYDLLCGEYGDRPCDPAEQSMRAQLAELRKLYREKQRELSKLSPSQVPASSAAAAAGSSSSSIRRLLRRSRGRPRKSRSSATKNSSAERGHHSPQDKEKSVERLRSASPRVREGDLSPPVLEPWSALPHCADSRIPPVLTPSGNQLTAKSEPHLDSPHTPHQDWTDDRDVSCKSPPTLSPVASSSAVCSLSSSSVPPSSTSHLHSSSKKRKVGRPKKRRLQDDVDDDEDDDDDDHHRHNHHHHRQPRDDSPAAKKMRCSKNALVGLLLGPGAKNRIAQTASAQHTAAGPASDANKPHKIRPKLKAEVKVKLWCEEEDGMEWTNISGESKMTSPLHMKFAHRRSSVPPEGTIIGQAAAPVVPKISGNGMRRPIKSKSLPGSIIQAKANKINKEKQAAPVIHKRRSLPAAMPSTSSHKTSEISPICISTIEELDTVECRLSLAAVECSLLPRRVLVAKGGLLYAGELAEIQAPDLYSVTLDGERAHRPHIYTQEEVLNDILQEVKLAVAPAQGTRVCAFWSQQYRCLYPGRVSSNQYQYPDHKFVCVEFDDGDDGRIPLDDIRLLPHDYPVVEYDPNPLLTLGKRKRRISTASSEHSTKTNITADLALDGSLEEIDEDIQERDEAIAEEDGHKTTEGEEEDDVEENGEDGDEQDNDDDNNEQEAGVVNEEEKIDEESDEGEENPEKDEESNGEADNNEKTIQEEEILNNKDVNSANGSAEVEPEASRKTVNVSTEEEKERRRLKKKKRDKHRLGMEEEGDGVAHKKKKKHRECCNKPHRHHKHKHHKHRHHKHRHSSVDGSETNKEEVDENGVAEAKVSDGRSVVRAPSRPLQADTSNMKEYKRQQHRDRQNSVEGGKSKMAAFLPAKQLWQWLGKGYKRPGAKGRSRKEFYKSIHRENETISVGDCAVFLSTGRPDRPFIGRIESMWSSWSHNMLVKVKWFYHPEETVGCPEKLTYPGALFESPHNDENDVQTISHKCEVLSLSDYKNWLSRDPERVETIYDYNDIYYLAGYYDPTNVNLTFEPGVI